MPAIAVSQTFSFSAAVPPRLFHVLVEMLRLVLAGFGSLTSLSSLPPPPRVSLFFVASGLSLHHLPVFAFFAFPALTVTVPAVVKQFKFIFEALRQALRSRAASSLARFSFSSALRLLRFSEELCLAIILSNQPLASCSCSLLIIDIILHLFVIGGSAHLFEFLSIFTTAPTH